MSGEGAKKDYARALEMFLAAARQGHAGALRTLGHMYENGIGVPAAPSEAARWYSLAAGHGEVRAMAAFGYLLFTGHGVPQNTEMGMRWLRMAGEVGEIDAQLLLGAIYDAGWTVAEDDEEALKWYALAAERGDPIALFMKACMHALGESVPADLVSAARDYRLSAAFGLAEARSVLENRYISLSGDDAGLKWKQGLLEKRPWYARDHLEKFYKLVAAFKGAALGDAEAMFQIGSFYWRGEGFEKDFEKAVNWWRLAARLGNEKAKDFFSRIDEFEKNGASGEALLTRVGNKELPAALVYEIGFDLLDKRGSARGIRPSADWINMLRRSREVSIRP